VRALYALPSCSPADPTAALRQAVRKGSLCLHLVQVEPFDRRVDGDGGQAGPGLSASRSRVLAPARRVGRARVGAGGAHWRAGSRAASPRSARSALLIRVKRAHPRSDCVGGQR
jgi:hypothetical protein